MNPRPVSPFHIALTLCGAFLLLFILAPLLGMALHTTWPELRAAASDAEVLRSIRLTLLVSLTATAAFSLFAIPFAWVLARRTFPGKPLLLALLDLPIVIPHSTAGIALLSVLNRNTVLGTIAERLGISFIGHPIGIALAMAFVSLPFLLNAAREGFAAVPERLEKTALTLGASPARVFRTISVPLARRAIGAGFVMMFARGLSEFGAVIIIAYHPMVTPVLIYERFTAFGLAHARGVALLFLSVSLLVFIALRMLTAGGRHARR